MKDNLNLLVVGSGDVNMRLPRSCLKVRMLSMFTLRQETSEWKAKAFQRLQSKKPILTL